MKDVWSDVVLFIRGIGSIDIFRRLPGSSKITGRFVSNQSTKLNIMGSPRRFSMECCMAWRIALSRIYAGISFAIIDMTGGISGYVTVKGF
jgi:hypothetical protein